MSAHDLPLDAAALLDAARHAQAEAASLQSPAHDIQATLRDLHVLLLSTDERALRSSVGFIGRLLGRDIDLQAESDALRERLGLLVLQARQHGEALDRHNRALVALRDRLAAIAARLGDVIAGSDANHPDATANHDRLRLLESTRIGCALTSAQLDVLAQNGHALATRYQHMLPTVEGLLGQHRAVLAGQRDAVNLREAAALVASIEAGIAGTATSTSAPPMHAAAKESP